MAPSTILLLEDDADRLTGKPVLLGIPTYEDPGVDYHHPDVENITNALMGVHRGLAAKAVPTNNIKA